MKHTVLLAVMPALLLPALFTSCKKDNSDSSSPLSGKWEQTSGPGGQIGCVAVSGNTLYAGFNGIYVSRDLGRTWSQPAGISASSPNAEAILIHHDTLLMVTNGVFRSTDGGATWNRIDDGKITCCMRSMSWSGNTVVLCTYNYGPVMVSNDNGATWTERGENIPDFEVYQAAVLGGDIFATSNSGVWKSTDNGQTFSLSNNGLTDLMVLQLVSDDDKLYAGTNQGLFLSTDHGGSWTLISNSLLQGNGISCLAVQGSTILFGTYSGLFYSADGGASWSKAVNGLPDPWISTLAVNGSTFLAGCLSGLYLSKDGGITWEMAGFPNTTVSHFACSGDEVYACAHYARGGVYMTPDFGEKWIFRPGGLPVYEVTDLAWNGDKLIAATDSGVFISSDRGLSYIKKSNGLPEMDEYNYVVSVAGNGNDLYAGTFETGMYVSHDGGGNWNKATLPGSRNYYATCFHINDEGIYAGMFANGVLFSADHGQTWVEINSGLPTVTAITSFAQKGSKLFISALAGVYLSENKGASWVPAGTELAGKVVNGLAVSGNDIFAVTQENGVYRSTNEGKNWTAVNDGLPSGIRLMSICANGSWLFLGTQKNGVWKHPL